MRCAAATAAVLVWAHLVLGVASALRSGLADFSSLDLDREHNFVLCSGDDDWARDRSPVRDPTSRCPVAVGFSSFSPRRVRIRRVPRRYFIVEPQQPLVATARATPPPDPTQPSPPQPLGSQQACSNVEVAVSHKTPWCATAVVITFLVAVIASIIVCSYEIQNNRRRLRGTVEYFEVY